MPNSFPKLSAETYRPSPGYCFTEPLPSIKITPFNFTPVAKFRSSHAPFSWPQQVAYLVSPVHFVGLEDALHEGKTGYCPAAGIPMLRQALADGIGKERGGASSDL